MPRHRWGLSQPALPSLTTRLADWLPALPLLIVGYGLLVLPLLVLCLQSLTTEGHLTLDHWVTVFTSPRYRSAILTSLGLATGTATVSLLVGSPVAWLIYRMAPLPRALWLALLNTATHLSGIGLAFGLIALLGSYGLVTLVLRQLPLPLTLPPTGSFGSLMLAYGYVNIPLFVLLTLPTLGSLRPSWWEAAQTAGATRWQFWCWIGCPILVPFLGAGWLLVFTSALGLYGLPLALAGNNPRLSLITLHMGDSLTGSFSGQGEAAVLAVLLLGLVALALGLYRWLWQRAASWR